MIVGTQDHVEKMFLHAAGETTHDVKKSAIEALYKTLYPDQSLAEEELKSLKGKLKQEERLLIERCLLELVFKISCEAEETNVLMMDYIHPLSKGQSVLPRILDMVLSLGEDSYLEPGFIFTLIQQLVEVAMKAEENLKLIDWIISNKAKLKQDHVLSRGKLIFLRAVNRMLKLLQRDEEHSVYYGKMLFCMSELYTMAERSATNHSGLKATSHPINLASWNRPVNDDFGKPVDKNIYSLYWKLLETVQSHVSSENEIARLMDAMHKLLDYFRDFPCKQTQHQLPVSLLNNTSPEQFNYIFRDPDCRMECLVQIYVFLQRLRSPMKHPIAMSDPVKLRISSCQQILVNYVMSDSELKARWEPIQRCLLQEPTWIDWKHNGAKEWALPASADHPWKEQYSCLAENLTLEEIADAATGSKDAMDVDQKDKKNEETWEMKAAEGLHGQFNRNLDLPDLDELKVPTAHEFLRNVLEDKEELKDLSESLESNTSFCWRTYRLLSEHDISHMVNSEHRNKFGKLLQDLDLEALADLAVEKQPFE